MTTATLAVDITITLLVTIAVLNRYGRLRENYTVTIVTLLAWFCSATIVLILPLDVSSTFYWDCLRRWYCSEPGHGNTYGCAADEIFSNDTAAIECRQSDNCDCVVPWSYVSSTALPNFWRFIYWTLQLLTWIVLPLLQTYMTAGDFTVGQRLKTSLRANAVAYLSLGLIVLILIIYLSVKQHMTLSGLEQLAIASSNTWGLLLVVIMLGYGIVDVPRLFWRRYSLDYSMRLYQFRVGTMYHDLADAQEKLTQVYDSVKEMTAACPRDEHLWKYVEIILARCPFDANEAAERFSRHDVALITRRSLARLHAKVKHAQLVVGRYEALYADLLEKAIDIEDVLKQSNKSDRTFVSSIRPPPTGFLSDYMPTILWWWKVKIRRVVYLCLAVLATGCSLAVVWSEVTFFQSEPTISIYAILISAIGHNGQYFDLELIAFLTLFYLSFCTYRVIFRMRIFNFYNLVPKQQTDAASLIFAAILLSRLTIPLCLNFLSMAHLDSHVTAGNIAQPTAFTQVMGHVDFFGFIKDFNTYYPITILLVSLATILRLGSRILGFCGVPSLVVDDETAQDAVSEGKMLIRRERRARQRGEALGHQSFGVQIPRAVSSRLDDADAGDDDDDDGGGAEALTSVTTSRPMRSMRRSRSAAGRGAPSGGRLSLVNGVRRWFGFDGGSDAADTDDLEDLLAEDRLDADSGARVSSSSRTRASRNGTKKKKAPRNVFANL